MNLYEKNEKIIKKLESKFNDDVIKLNPFEMKLYAFRTHFNDLKGKLFKNLNDIAENRLIKYIKQNLTLNALNLIKFSEFNYYWLYELKYIHQKNKTKLSILSAITNFNTAIKGRYN